MERGHNTPPEFNGTPQELLQILMEVILDPSTSVDVTKFVVVLAAQVIFFTRVLFKARHFASRESAWRDKVTVLVRPANGVKGLGNANKKNERLTLEVPLSLLHRNDVMHLNILAISLEYCWECYSTILTNYGRYGPFIILVVFAILLLLISLMGPQESHELFLWLALGLPSVWPIMLGGYFQYLKMQWYKLKHTYNDLRDKADYPYTYKII